MPQSSDPRRALLLAGLILCLAPVAAQAQTLGMGAPDDPAPVEVLADNGIEWMRDGKRFVARGNASAARNDTTVYADTLTAHYRENAAGKSELWRLDADGHVRIVSPTETATGDTAVYDIGAAVLVLRGKPNAKLVTPDTTVTATEQLEYWDAKRFAVARGNAVVVRADRTLKADTVIAYFAAKTAAKSGKKAKSGNSGAPGQGSDIDIVDAHGHVVITTKTETVTGDKGRYNVKTGIATLLNNVGLTRGTDTLNGAYAVVNMNTGVSTLYSQLPGAKAEKPSPVRGRFIPKKAEPLPEEDKGGAEGKKSAPVKP
ncbi:LptA/OstA family protein [Oleispirillum naphthae]|uniref:LptA/OstA family protein n=1 Tax=Oleispirillum naphthae TaxID=2838853 RepID=UPI003082474B